MQNQKTAMQEVWDKLMDYDLTTYEIHAYLQLHKNRLLEKEKEQIKDAFVAGSERGTKDIPYNCEQYYSQLFS